MKELVLEPEEFWGEYFYTLGGTMKEILRQALKHAEEVEDVLVVDALDSICRHTGELGSGGVGAQIRNLKKREFLRELGQVRKAGYPKPVKRLQLTKPRNISRPLFTVVGPMTLEVMQGDSKHLVVLKPKEKFSIVTKG